MFHLHNTLVYLVFIMHKKCNFMHPHTVYVCMCVYHNAYRLRLSVNRIFRKVTTRKKSEKDDYDLRQFTEVVERREVKGNNKICGKSHHLRIKLSANIWRVHKIYFRYLLIWRLSRIFLLLTYILTLQFIIFTKFTASWVMHNKVFRKIYIDIYFSRCNYIFVAYIRKNKI